MDINSRRHREPPVALEPTGGSSLGQSFFTAFLMVLAALVAGGAVYFSQKKAYDNQIQDLNSQISSLQKQVNGSSSDITTLPTPTPDVSPTSTASPSSSASSDPFASLSSSTFDVTKAKVGDTVADMTIKSIAPYDATKGKISTTNAKIAFTGEATITGEYQYHAAGEFGSPAEVCIASVDSTSIAKVPAVSDDSHDRSFCFSNQTLAKSSFGTEGTKGTATVTIKNYVINAFPSEVTNEAELVTVISKKKTGTL